jgi:imidazolonepropionase-like amidohydrolase
MQTNAFANQSPTTIPNGSQDDRHTMYAFINAHIYVDDETQLEKAVMIVKDNEILDVGSEINIPESAQIINVHGAKIYPGFILMDSSYGLPKLPKKKPFSYSAREILQTTTKGASNANEAIKAQFRAVNEFHQDDKTAKPLRALGFSSVLSFKKDGIMRGSSVLVSLNGKSDQQSIINQDQSFHLSFDKGSSKQYYPVSLMGSAALLRQSWLDAQWYGKGQSDFTDLDLQAINDNQNVLNIFSVNNWQEALLADKIAKEFDKNIVLKTAGDEYKHIDAIKKINRSLIVPLSFPKAMDVSDEIDAWNATLDKMMEWESAPYNLYHLNKNNIDFAIIPKDQKTFFKDLQKAVSKGLPKSAALAALTSTPANMLANKKIGHLRKGAQANFIIAQDDLFEKGGKVSENWVSGERFIIKPLSKIKPGKYQLEINGTQQNVTIENKGGKLKLSHEDKENKTKYKAKITDGFVTVEIKEEEKKTQLLGLVANNSMKNIEGHSPKWSLTRISDSKTEEKKAKLTDKSVPKIPQPFSSYGLHKPSDAGSFLIKNTTVWTNEESGILKETDVFIKAGKIEKIGKDLKVKANMTIDGKDLHLTAGIIDEHSHIALLSVNDVATNSSMVRMQDVIDSDDVDIYRNLAGGVTAAQLLHGSANPIGGQSALIKMRWGATSDELLIKNADGFIKFALGENVKRSRSPASIRYPLTRMGVEQVYRDAFNNARAYEVKWAAYNKLSKSKKKRIQQPRRDLMLEATLEVINKKLFVTSHSYVQSEINMLMKVAEDFDFNINTFTHILEGYKVADKMLAHGAGASTFADWWAYKWEVNFAIPYNASILNKVGVTTAINSDDAEMSRRLNQEAAKSIKYGGLTEEEALKLVTLNPAKLLHLDDQMGSIKVGKDADIVLWSDNPLSIYAQANKTFVDGKLLFDRDMQKIIEANIAKEKARLVGKINNSGEAKLPPSSKPSKQMQCDSFTGYEYFLGAVQ